MTLVVGTRVGEPLTCGALESEAREPVEPARLAGGVRDGEQPRGDARNVEALVGQVGLQVRGSAALHAARAGLARVAGGSGAAVPRVAAGGVLTARRLGALAGRAGLLGLLGLVGGDPCAAGQTRRIRLGPSVSPVTLREPTLIAQALATLDELSGGRAEAVGGEKQPEVFVPRFVGRVAGMKP